MLSFSRNILFYQKPIRLILSIALPLIVFLIWDVYAVHTGHWFFNSEYVIGIKLFNLPIEEILFFIIIPFSSLFLWESVKYFTGRKK
jgi:lycopene cyclase domain-containing protein